MPTQKSPLSAISPLKVLLPMLIGLGVTGYTFWSDDKLDANDIQSFFWKADYAWLFAALLMLLFRDIAYMYRIYHLCKGELSWQGSVYTILLWEFASTISPSTVGGTAVASFILAKEGISFGKSVAYIIITAVLDNLFFIIFGGVVLFGHCLDWYGIAIFPTEKDLLDLPISAFFIQITFYSAYFVFLIYTLLMLFGLFGKPEAIKYLFVQTTRIFFLRRFKETAEKQGDELIAAASQIRGLPKMYWFKAGISTMVIWLARYGIVNCLIMSVADLGIEENYYILSRHVIIWIMLILGFTPGAAGIAEYSFQAFFKIFAGNATAIVSVVWRLLTYYPYLFLGTLVFPLWLKRVEQKKEMEENQEKK